VALLPTVGGFLPLRVRHESSLQRNNPAWHLKADIKRAQDIRENIPQSRKIASLEQSLFPASSGYPSVRSELGATAKKMEFGLDDFASKETKIANAEWRRWPSTHRQWGL